MNQEIAEILDGYKASEKSVDFNKEIYALIYYYDNKLGNIYL